MTQLNSLRLKKCSGRSTIPRSDIGECRTAKMEPLLRLKFERWHAHPTYPFRAGLAVTNWQLMQAEKLGQRDYDTDNTLVVLALANKPRDRGQWALAVCKVSKAFDRTDTATVKELVFAPAVSADHRALMAALADATTQAVNETWGISKIDYQDRAF